MCWSSTGGPSTGSFHSTGNLCRGGRPLPHIGQLFGDVPTLLTVLPNPWNRPKMTPPALLLPCTIITLIRHGTVSSAMLPAPPRSLRGLCLRYRGGSILSQRFWLTLSPAVAKGRFSDKWSQSPINWGESTQMRDPAKAGLLPFAVGLKAGGATPWGASLL